MVNSINLQDFDNQEFDGTTVDGTRVYSADQVDAFLENRVRPTLEESFKAVAELKNSSSRGRASQESVEILDMASKLANEHVEAAKERALSLMATAEEQKAQAENELEIIRTRTQNLKEYGETVKSTLLAYITDITTDVDSYNISDISAPEGTVLEAQDENSEVEDEVEVVAEPEVEDEVEVVAEPEVEDEVEVVAEPEVEEEDVAEVEEEVGVEPELEVEVAAEPELEAEVVESTTPYAAPTADDGDDTPNDETEFASDTKDDQVSFADDEESATAPSVDYGDAPELALDDEEDSYNEIELEMDEPGSHDEAKVELTLEDDDEAPAPGSGIPAWDKAEEEIELDQN